MNPLAQAQALYRAGRVRDASSLLGRVLRSSPNDAEAMRLLAEIQFQSGYQREALKLAERAVQVDPHNAAAWNALGLIRHLLGQNEGALDCFQNATAADEKHWEAWTNQAFVLQALGRHEEAISCLTGVPPNPQPLFFLGNSYAATGRQRLAVAAFDDALRLAPEMAEAWNNRGTSLLALGLVAESVESLTRAHKLQPTENIFISNLATSLHRIGRSEEALGLLSTASGPMAARAAAEILNDFGRDEEAANLLAQASSDASSLSPLARIRQNQGHWRQAIELLRGSDNAAHRLQEAVTLPVILDSVDDVAEAREHMQTTLTAAATSGARLVNPLEEIGLTTFFLAYHGIGERDLQVKTAHTYRDLYPRLKFAAQHTPGRGARIRLGVMSGLLHDHTIGRLFASTFSLLDPDRFELVFLQLGKSDSTSERLASRSDRHVPIPPALYEAMETVAEEELDVLVYPEVGMVQQTYYMAFARLAPVQCVLWGHPMATGSPEMDYFISSEHLERVDGQDEYSEQLVRLPSLTTYFHRRKTPPPAAASEFGLPEGKHLYGCLQTLFKFHPDFDPVLEGILQRDEKGLLVLLEPKVSTWKDLLLDRWRRAHPVLAERSIFLPSQPPERYLALSALCDAILDPIQFGGGNSSLECFAVGAPVVTLPGALLRNRITYAAYKQIGFEDLIASSEASYIDLAVRLATDGQWRRNLRTRVAAESSPLFENHAAVEELAGFLANAQSNLHRHA